MNKSEVVKLALRVLIHGSVAYVVGDLVAMNTFDKTNQLGRKINIIGAIAIQDVLGSMVADKMDERLSRLLEE